MAMNEDEASEQARKNCEYYDNQQNALEAPTIPMEERQYASPPPLHSIELSKAISLKRIADMLEKLVPLVELWEDE